MAPTTPLEAVTEATKAIFKSWTALQLTVEHHLIKHYESVDWLVEDTVELITSSSPICTEEMLVDFFHEQFDDMETDVEDGSPEQVARQIIRIRNAAARGDLSPACLAIDSVTALSANSVIKRSVNGGTVACHDDDDSDHDHDHDHAEEGAHKIPSHCGRAQKQAPVVDEDGFTQVTRKGQKQAPVVDDDGFTQVTRKGH